ncbi:uncharacterized protein LOC124911944 isoform X2 [Impatiens glandulifera]|uniref:uncharacterized protein LOC124911944 isoform X2 n=1 Tax=Impatiens glandulifera TaxID=253017 RepID=UPI001FB0F568|nr:uncharacterized protein LOC124911944 isoform X2 [Impatiens glandulifera]
MASSQVEIASFVPFGCVLRRDQSRRGADRFSINTTAGDTTGEDFSCPNNTHDVSRQERETSPTHSESSTEIPNHGGVSSLVKKWKDLSGEHQNGEDMSPQPPPESLDIEPSATPPATDSAVGQSKRVVRVADVIRKLTTDGDDSELDHHRRLQIPEQRHLFSAPFVNSPRIRGRQALTDLLLQLEKERRSELDGLLQRRPVSNFSHKGKIQALLRLRFLHREAVNRYQDHLNNPMPIRYNLHRGKEKVRQQPQSHLSEETTLPCNHHPRDDSTISDRKDCNPSEQHPRDDSAISGRKDCNPTDHHPRGDSTISDRKDCNPTDHHPRDDSTISDRKDCNPTDHHPRDDSTISGRTDCNPTDHHPRDDSTISGRTDCNPTEQHLPHLDSTTSEYKSIVTLRDRFNHGIESDVTNPKRARRDLVNKYVENFSTDSLHINEIEEPTSLVNLIEEKTSTSSSQNSIVYTPKEIHERSGSFPDEEKHRMSEENRYHYNRQGLSTSSSKEEHVEKEEEDEWKGVFNQIIVDTKNEDSSSDMSQSRGDFEEEEEEEEEDGVNCQEVEIDEQQGANCDWTNDICRPISDWEDLRQARYDEMLNPFNSNQDIQHLLERRNVSTFLFSNLRQKIDQLMISRSNTLPHQPKEEPLSQSRTKQLMTSQIPGEMHVPESGQEGGSSDDRISYYKDPDITGSESECSIRSCYEVNDSSDPHDESPDPTSQSPILDITPHSSFQSQSSMEIELIHDLRGHMLQLQQEMSKLRKSMKHCMEMQANLQKSIKKEVAAAVKHEVASILVELEDMGETSKKEKGSPNHKKGICSICNEMPVDSLLYRCGHMCACFKCAHQLQIESGRCPVCSSPIEDVVLASIAN